MRGRKYTNKDIVNIVNEKWNGDFTIINEDFKYENVHQHILVRCNKCGNEYEKRINDLLHGYGCNRCANLKRRTNEEMRNYIKDISNGDYELISEHNRTRDIALFKHNNCNCKNPDKEKVFKMKIHNFITVGERCPYCAEFSKGIRDSKGIKRIKKFLEENNIEYIQEYKNKKCTSKNSNKLLSFDLYIEDLNTLIEFDGIQHFKPVDIFGGEEYYEKLKRNDLIKNNFAKKYGFNLIRISYKDYYKIENILTEKLLS